MKTLIKSLKNLWLISLAIVFLSAMLPGKTYSLDKNFAVTIHGTSNIHNWVETVGTVAGHSTVKFNDDGSFDLEAVEIRMNVHSIKSEKGSVMENNTYKALKGSKYPEIIFTLSEPLKALKSETGPKTVLAKGRLFIAGRTNVVSFMVKISMQGKLKLKFEGSETIKMTDYGIDPPSALLGTIKTGNGITIRFNTNFTNVPL